MRSLMGIRLAAASGLALAAALVAASPGRAQSFFSFYEMSPRQIAGRLADDGYDLRGPMLRRGDVYICDVTTVSGRPARLIVAAHDGHILERFALRTPRWREFDEEAAPRPPRDLDEDSDSGDRDSRREANRDDEWASTHQEALGDLFNSPSRVYGGDNVFTSKPPEPEDTPVQKPKRHATKKHKDPSLAKAPAATPSPDSASGDKPADSASPSSVAAVAPTAASPEPKKPAADAVKAEVKPEAAPKAVAAPEPAKPAEEKRAAVEPKPVSAAKPDQPRKKLNDLPVGTLD